MLKFMKFKGKLEQKLPLIPHYADFFFLGGVALPPPAPLAPVPAENIGLEVQRIVTSMCSLQHDDPGM